MTAARISLYIGGGLNVGWAVFHLLFPRIFKWSESLAGLDALQRAIHQVMNLCLVFFFLAMAYLSFFFNQELVSGPLGAKLLGIFGIFWLFRFGLQFRFFSRTHPTSLLLSLFFLATAAAYFIPLFNLPG